MAALFSSLQEQRKHVLGVLDGLGDEALLVPVLPTGWTCLGLVQHLAIDVKRFWFRDVFAGELETPDNDPPSAWQVAPGTPVSTVFDLYRHEIELANDVIANGSPDAPPGNWPDDRWPDGKLSDFRSILLHVITETACHAGHLDAARELLDGRTWLVIEDES